MRCVKLSEINLLPRLPQPIAEHPGMISRQERQLLYTLAAKEFRGHGCIIDAGTFLGASTMAFGMGLVFKRRTSTTKPIIAFERATVHQNFAPHAEKAGLPCPAQGESFAPILEKLIEPVADQVELHIGDILQYDGADLPPVEICFLDILKSPEVTRHVMPLFFRKLQARSLVVQQDYFCDRLPFIKVLMEKVASHFDYLGEVRSSAVFRMRKPLSASDLGDLAERLAPEQQLALHAQAEERTTDRARRYLMRLSRAHLLVDLGEVDQSAELCQAADREFADLVFDKKGEYASNIAWRIPPLWDRIERRRQLPRGPVVH